MKNRICLIQRIWKRTHRLFSHVLLSFVMALSQAAQAELPILLRGPGVSEDLFLAYAKANNYVTASERLNSRLPDKNKSDLIHQNAEQAQSAWLSGNIELARRLFRRLSELALHADWRPAQRETLQYALLRLAQTSNTQKERQDWLEQAVSLFPDLNINTELMPPPLITEFVEVRNQMMKLARTIEPGLIFPGYQILIINGRRFKIESSLKIALPSGQHRITALSDVFPPYSDLRSSAQLEVTQVTRSPMIRGTCQQPAYQAPAIDEFVNFDVLFESNCLQRHRDHSWLSLTSSKAALMSPENTRAPSSGALAAQFDFSTDEGQSVQRRWFWIGLSALTAGALYALSQELREPQPEQRVAPVHHRGF